MVEGAERRCAECAARQHGVISRVQALALGLTRHQVHQRVVAGRWERVLPSVFRLSGTVWDWHQRLQAACLWAGRGFALSHKTAAALWGLPRFPRGPVELSVARNVRQADRLAVHRVLPFGAKEVVVLEGFRVTSAARTLIDLAAEETVEDLRSSLDDLLRRGRVTPEALQAALARRSASRGIQSLANLVRDLAEGAAPTESELEALCLDVIDGAGLPRPSKQTPFFDGKRLMRIDFTWPAERVVLEADSRRHHLGALAFERDRVRSNSLTARGWRVLRWTWSALKSDPGTLVDELEAALAPIRSMGLASTVTGS
jgi:hypothetical protein